MQGTISPRVSKVDARKVIRDRSRGLTLSEIAAKQGVSRQAVHHTLKGLDKLIINKEELENYRNNEVSMLDAAKMKFLVAAIDNRKLKSASALQCVTGYAVLTDKSLLLQGKATQIVETKSVLLQARMDLDKLRAEQEAMQAAQIIDSKPVPGDTNVDK